jgi:hypothetical protein
LLGLYPVARKKLSPAPSKPTHNAASMLCFVLGVILLCFGVLALFLSRLDEQATTAIVLIVGAVLIYLSRRLQTKPQPSIQPGPGSANLAVAPVTGKERIWRVASQLVIIGNVLVVVGFAWLNIFFLFAMPYIAAVSGVTVAYLIAYLIAKRAKTLINLIMVTIGLVLSLCLFGFSLWGTIAMYQHADDWTKEQNAEYAAAYQRLKSSPHAFDLLTPAYLPKGFEHAVEQLDGEEVPLEEVTMRGLFSRDNPPASFETYIMKKRANFTPPADCGHHWGYIEDPPRVHPCRLVGQTSTGRNVYFHHFKPESAYDDSYDAYYVEYGRSVATVSFKTGNQSLSQSEAIQVLGSLTATTIEEVSERNLKAK